MVHINYLKDFIYSAKDNLQVSDASLEESCDYFASDIGIIELKGTKYGLTSVQCVEKVEQSSATLFECVEKGKQQLGEYFSGNRQEFDLEVLLNGTDFQLKIWKQLLQIPYGQTVSYKQLAEKSGNVYASRAVGNANNRNRIAIIIPCHRVISADGSISGYAGGVWRKRWLLNFEEAESSCC